jgi:hypothetical protein
MFFGDKPRSYLSIIWRPSQHGYSFLEFRLQRRSETLPSKVAFLRFDFLKKHGNQQIFIELNLRINIRTFNTNSEYIEKDLMTSRWGQTYFKIGKMIRTNFNFFAIFVVIFIYITTQSYPFSNLSESWK